MFHRVSSAHNKAVTQQIIDKVNSQEYSDKIAIACKSQSYNMAMIILLFMCHLQMLLRSTMNTW